MAGCLRGVVKTVDQLVKVGTMVEKDCSASKKYWQKVDYQRDMDRGDKKGEKEPRKGRTL